MSNTVHCTNVTFDHFVAEIDAIEGALARPLHQNVFERVARAVAIAAVVITRGIHKLTRVGLNIIVRFIGLSQI